MQIEDIIPEIKVWQSANKNFTVFDYIGVKSSYEQIIAISKLFFPDIVCVDGYILLKDSCQKIDATEFFNNIETMADFEKVMNFICLGNLFQ
jgi:hypothetical protein